MAPNNIDRDQLSSLEYTIAHFKEIARQNRFAENSAIDHDVSRCVICHPDLVPRPPFLTYLDVITPSIKVRRPRLDRSLVEEINGDLAMLGEDFRVTLELLMDGDERSMQCWRDWVQTALATGLGLLSIHSPTSLDFDLDEEREGGMEAAIEEKVREIMNDQLMARDA